MLPPWARYKLPLSTSLAVIVHRVVPRGPTSRLEGRRSLKSYLSAGTACVVTAAVVGLVILDFTHGGVVTSTVQWLCIGSFYRLLMGQLSTAQQDFPTMFWALSGLGTVGLLTVAINHTGHQWDEIRKNIANARSIAAISEFVKSEVETVKNFGATFGLASCDMVELLNHLKHGFKRFSRTGRKSASAH